MASIIEGYSYDIFISYRQKDNKYDGWVTDFAENLKNELEATFKEEVSVYFDINPVDGLLETHDVDASLKDKLKCLVFIPIISRTYCDPKSFAWEHEFKVFVEQVSQDKFGLKIRLPDGNIAGRVLPVRIHDLNNADIKLCETIIGGVLRGVEFIYKSQGINRPLLSKEENPHDNLNRTFYRDQINKVANAINEIISGLQMIESSRKITEADVADDGRHKEKSPALKISGEKEYSEQQTKRTDQSNAKSWIYSVTTLVISILTVFAMILFSSGSILPFDKRDWILIADFENLTENPVFDRSLYTAFSLSTSQSRYINVFPRSRMLESLERMEITDQTIVDENTGREMAIREGIKLYIIPSISEAGNRFAIAAKIIDTQSEDILKSEIFYVEAEDEILAGLDKLSKKIRRDLGESRYNISLQDKPLKKVTTSSLEALKLYSMGIDQHLKLDFEGAKKYYEAAILIDTGFTSARASLGNINIERFNPEIGRELLRQAIKSADNLTERERLGILAFYASNVEKNLPKAIEYNNTRIDLYPDDATAHNNAGWYYQNSGEYEKAVSEYKEAVRVDPKTAIAYAGMLWTYLEFLGEADSALAWSEKMISENPYNAWGYFYMGSAWIIVDSVAKAELYFQKAREINPDLILNLYRLAHTCRIQQQYDEAIPILEHILEIDNGETSAYYDIGVNFQAMGNLKKAREYYSTFKKIALEEWIKKYPDDVSTYTSLAAVSARLGNMDSSRMMLQKAIGIDSVSHESFAEVLCLQGKVNEALIQIQKALDKGYRDLFWLKINPDLEILKYDTRFRDLLNKYFN
jgi:tetratricopeptide (TPR) repeat protein